MNLRSRNVQERGTLRPSPQQHGRIATRKVQSTSVLTTLPPYRLTTLPPYHLITAYHLTTLQPYHLAALPTHHLTTLSPYHLTTLQPYHLAALPPHHLTTLRPYNLTTLQPYHLTTLPPYHLTTLGHLKLGCSKCRQCPRGCKSCIRKLMIQKGKQVPEAAVRAPGQSSRHRVPSNANTSAPQQPATPLMQTSAGNGRSADTSISQRFPKLPAVFHNVLNHMLKAQAPTGDGEILASQRKACKSGSPWFYRFFRSQSARLNEKGGAGMQTYYFYPWQHGIRDIPMFHDLSTLPSAMLPIYHTHFLQSGVADKDFIRTALIIPARTRFQDFMATYQVSHTAPPPRAVRSRPNLCRTFRPAV